MCLFSSMLLFNLDGHVLCTSELDSLLGTVLWLSVCPGLSLISHSSLGMGCLVVHGLDVKTVRFSFLGEYSFTFFTFLLLNRICWFFFKPEDISGKELNQYYGKVILYCQGDKKDGCSLFGDALREYVSLGSLERTEIYFSQFWMLDVQSGGSGSGGAFLLPPPGWKGRTE